MFGVPLLTETWMRPGTKFSVVWPVVWSTLAVAVAGTTLMSNMPLSRLTSRASPMLDAVSTVSPLPAVEVATFDLDSTADTLRSDVPMTALSDVPLTRPLIREPRTGTPPISLTRPPRMEHVLSDGLSVLTVLGSRVGTFSADVIEVTVLSSDAAGPGRELEPDPGVELAAGVDTPAQGALEKDG